MHVDGFVSKRLVFSTRSIELYCNFRIHCDALLSFSISHETKILRQGNLALKRVNIGSTNRIRENFRVRVNGFTITRVKDKGQDQLSEDTPA